MYSASCFDFQALWQDLSHFVSSFRCYSSLFMIFELQASGYSLPVSRQPQSISGCTFQHPNTLHFSSLFNVSECLSWVSKCYFWHPDTILGYPDTLRLSNSDLYLAYPNASSWHPNTTSQHPNALYGIRIPHSRILEFVSSKLNFNLFSIKYSIISKY